MSGVLHRADGVHSMVASRQTPVRVYHRLYNQVVTSVSTGSKALITLRELA
jgi:hypothetical protein